MRRGFAFLAPLALVILAFLAVVDPAGATLRYVNRTDPTCGGAAPCYSTIQSAVNAAVAGDTITIQPAGVYVEPVVVQAKNSGSGAREIDRILIQGDPAAPPGSVVLSGVAETCGGKTVKAALQFRRSKFVTVRGLTILGNGGVGVLLSGGGDASHNVRLERLRIVGNGSACSQGVTLETSNTATLLANTLIYGHGKNGVEIQGQNTGPQYVVQNAIHGNGWNGVWIARGHQVWLVNNVITLNGRANGTTGGRSGVFQDSHNFPKPELVVLASNLVCGNRGGEVSGPALDPGDSGNLTPTGSEGPGMSASPGCESPAVVFANVHGPDGIAGTVDDDFTPLPGSPTVDAGIDPMTFNLPLDLEGAVTVDFFGTARPRIGHPGGVPRFDIGPVEIISTQVDTVPPAVAFLQPAATAHVRGVITLEAQASDPGSGVASVALGVGATTVATLTNPGPQDPFIASAPFDTTTVPDGAHTLRATATDRAGNERVVTQTMLVDNTPPVTAITAGPSGTVATRHVTFQFTGSDNLTPSGSLLFSWRIDGGPFSAFGPATSASFADLSDGAHTFEVKTRDLAGNEDPLPASRAFAIALGPTIMAIDPASAPVGALVTITGERFEPGVTQVTFNGVLAQIRSISATAITTTVPIGATTGNLRVTTPAGTAVAAFTLLMTGEFALVASPEPPATVRVIAGDEGAVVVHATGSGAFASLVSLAVTPAVVGIVPTFSSPLVVPGTSVFLTFAVGASVAPGIYTFTVAGHAQVDGHTLTRSAPLAVEVIAPETRALTGSVMTAESVPRPIPGVTITLGSAFTLTDAAGNFVLLAPPSGPNMLFVDGRTASTPEAQFPIVETQVNVAGSGPSRVPFVIYLPKLDTAHAVALPVDATGFTIQAVEARTPSIPGLEVMIPAGTRIIDGSGNPVAELVITPVAVDRSPMPFPAGISPPLLFAINPGGAVPSQPLPIRFPNVTNAPPGARADLYYFSLAAGDWRTWGTGTVSADGTQVVSDPGFGLPRLAWHFFALQTTLADQTHRRNPTGGDPVDLVTGRFVADHTDLALPGRIPIAVPRTYRSENPAAGALGIGWNLDVYETRLIAAGGTLSLVLPNQATYLLNPTGPGQWTNPSEPFLRGAVVTQLPGEFNFQLRFKDGVVHRFDRIVGFANLAALAAITDRHGNGVTVTRATVGSAFGRITHVVGPSGRTLTFGYDAAGRIATVTDPINRIVRYAYDALGRLTTVTDPAGGVTTYAYDSAHRIVAITDPRQITYLANEYDAAGRVVRQTQADGGVWTYAYTLAGTAVTATTVTNPRGAPATYRFTVQGFPLSVTDALGQTTVFEYGAGSNLLAAVTDPLGRRTELAYDAFGNVTAETRLAGTPAAVTTTLAYEPVFHQPISVSDPLGRTVHLHYDASGNLTSVVDALGHAVALAYEPGGELKTITDPAGTTEFTHTGGVLTAVRDPLGQRWSGQMDAAGRLVEVSDPLGRVTRRTLDSLNQVTAVTDPLGGLTSLQYDPNGNLLGVTDARGGVTRYTYDVMDQLLTRRDPLLRPDHFGYNAGGNLTTATDRKGQVATRAYDPLDRLVAVAHADGTTTTLTYDVAGRVTEVSDSGGDTIVLGYDAFDRLVSETTARGTVSYSYDAAGRRIGLSIPGQSPVTYAYDDADRLVEIAQGSATVAFVYDAAGRRTRVTLPNGVATDYTYDAASRLTALTYTRGGTVLGTLTYGYDAAGNRTTVGGTWARTALPPPLATATYDAANQHVAFDGETLTYDANGNLTSDGENVYTWDARDRLVAITGATSATFAYDALGRRARKTIGGLSTAFVHDGLNPVQELAPDGSSTDLLTGLGLDEYFTRSDATGSRALLVDALGTVIALSDATGSVDTEYTYEPFGTPHASGLPATNPFQFTAREHDGTGLYYYRARYYHPRLQRFISEDPLEFGGGDVNLYAYVGSDPLGYADPLGLAKCSGFSWSAFQFALDAGTFVPVLNVPFSAASGSISACQGDAFGVAAATAGIVTPGAGATLKATRWGLQHGGLRHWERIIRVADAMKRQGWRDIRINRQQVDASGNVVGRNRPDVTALHPRTLQRHNIEVDVNPRRSQMHRATITANDANARNTFILLTR